MFETLLNKKTDNLRLPDYDDIEIKALLKKNHYDLTLFSIIPQLDNMSFDQIISYFFRTFFYENINLKGKIVNPKFYSTISSNQTVYLRNNLSFKLILMILTIELCCHIIVKLNLQLAELYIGIILT